MDVIADSRAFRNEERVLPQHQAALLLLQALLSDPKVNSVRWLDLACGQGQALAGISGGLSPAARSKIDYVGYDIRSDYLRETGRIASSVGFHSHDVKVGDLTDACKLLGTDQFMFITLTNTIHEVHPRKLALVLVDAVSRISSAGKLFIYDMENIRPPELGAVPWSAGDMNKIVRQLMSALNVKNYDPPVGHWSHRTCDAWSVQVDRDHLAVSDDQLRSLREAALDATERTIIELLRVKYAQCREALEKLTKYGSETADEQTAKETLLYQFWAISRALGVRE